jgi:Tfp pilus assembly protein PilO
VKRKLGLDRHHKAFLVFAGLLFAASAAGSWFTWKACGTLEVEAATLAGQIGTMKKKVSGIDDLETEVIVLRENVAGYIRILPNDAEVNEFFRTISAFQRDSGITIDDLEPQRARTKLQTSQVFDRAEYKLKFTATFRQLLKFIERLENHERFVSISEVKVKAGKRDEKQAGEPVHEVDLSLVTYVYLGDAAGKSVSIPAYDRKRDRLVDRIAEAREDLALERFQLLSDVMRRDPLVDPRPRRDEAGRNGQGLEDQRALFNRVTARLLEAGQVLDLMAETKNVIREMELRVSAINMVAELQGQADEVGARGGFTDALLRRDWEKKVLPDLAKLRERVGGQTAPEGGAGRPTRVRQLEQALAAMEAHYEAGDYAACVKDFELIRISAAASGADPRVVELEGQMERYYLAAQTAVEFGKKQLDVTGLVVEAGAESVAIINHVVYRAGEAVEDDLVLVEIHEDRLVFEYRGVPLTYDL